MANTRIYGFKNTNSKTGRRGVSLEPEVARLVIDHCEKTHLNVTKFVNQVMLEYMQSFRYEKCIKMPRGKYRDGRVSVAGTFSPELNQALSARIESYCKETNQNKTYFVEDCVAEKLDELEPILYKDMDKADLIDLVIKLKKQSSSSKQEAEQHDQRQLCIL